MKTLRFLFFTLEMPFPSSVDGLPREEGFGSGRAWLLPASEMLREDRVPAELLDRFLSSQGALARDALSLALWTSQERICSALRSAGADVRGLPPIPGKVLQAYFAPSGRLWIGALARVDPSDPSGRSLRRSVSEAFSSSPIPTSPHSIPWIPDMSRGGAWALGASQSLGLASELIGFGSPRSRD